MNNLYNKIYEAIDNGIQKALIINNDLSTDTSVKWQEMKKTADINTIDEIVDNLLNENNNEYYYNLLIDYYKTTGFKYKCDDIVELYQIYNKIKEFGKDLRLFEWIDAKNSLSFILDNNKEISLNNYTEDMNPAFLKISSNDLRKENNDILIYIFENHYINTQKLAWENNWVQILDIQYLIKTHNMADTDYNGYETCQRIINNKHDLKVPAIEYCMKFKNINGHNGYLPAMGQLRIISDCLPLINYVFENIYIDAYIEPLTLNLGNWHTSSEYSGINNWTLRYSLTISDIKTDHYKVLPIFTL